MQNSVKDPTLRIRLVFFSWAASQAFLFSLARCRKISGLIDLIYQTAPGVAALRQEKPKLNWRILLQETEGTGNAKRWAVVAKGDKSEYGSWYARNVRDSTANLSRSRYTSPLERPRRVPPLRDKGIAWRSCRRQAMARRDMQVVLPLLINK
jgi:hypothetical protein